MSKILYWIGYAIAYCGHALSILGILIATRDAEEALSYYDWAYPLPTDVWDKEYEPWPK